MLDFEGFFGSVLTIFQDFFDTVLGPLFELFTSFLPL